MIKVLDRGFVRLVDHMGSDLSIVRAARVSYDADWRAGTDTGSDERLIRYLWRNHHTTPFEAVQFTFEVKAPIFVIRQWHRHRTWCLSGDTEITFELPCRNQHGIRTAKTMRLAEIYRKWQTTVRSSRPERQTNAVFKRERIKNMLLRVYDETCGEFTVGHIADVIFSGVKQIFEIELADGKRLKCSKDHRLLTTEGWQRLEDAVGLTITGGTAGMTRSASILTNGYVDGHVPWNKGVTGYKIERVMTDADRAAIRAARSGARSNFWKGGVTPERAKIARWTREQAPKVHAKFDYTCQDCAKRGGRLHAHHIESVVTRPDLALDFNNLITLCVSCHHIRHGRRGDGAMHRGRGQTLRAMVSRIVKIKIVGEEETFDLSVDGPHHNFVANGLIVHNSYNEVSARYTELPEEYYVPAPEVIGVQSKSNKQARVLGSSLNCHMFVHDLIDQTCENSFAVYGRLLSEGVPRELARTVLPVATYTRMFASVDLLNLLKFLTLRTHEHAQWEIREYAKALPKLIRPIVPVTVAAWEEGNV